jgi:hypothetical protein
MKILSIIWGTNSITTHKVDGEVLALVEQRALTVTTQIL